MVVDKVKALAIGVNSVKAACKLGDNDVPEENLSGAIVCPLCDGIMHYKVSSEDGTIRLQCETNRCLRL
jgi:Zn finger protein HypA/HybF involved in hydrogenase expression